MDRVTSRQLKAFRERNQLTQSDFARHLGISLPTAQRWESGRTKTPSSLGPALRELEMTLCLRRFVEVAESCRREKGMFETTVEMSETLARFFTSRSAADWRRSFGATQKPDFAERLGRASLLGGFSGLASVAMAPGLTLKMKDSASANDGHILVRKSLPAKGRKGFFARVFSP